VGDSGGVDRVKAISRYLELRPLVRQRMEGSVPPQLREEFASMTPHQLRALLALPIAGISMKELAEAMNVTGATASVLADRLVAQGLACRSHDATDRRVVRLAPSEQGKNVADKARRAQRQMAKALFSQLSDPQVEAFLDVMETMAAPRAAEPKTTLGERP
jgi:DNA-binding MarR family transcriptional regulator